MYDHVLIVGTVVEPARAFGLLLASKDAGKGQQFCFFQQSR